jgi:hypothetical protein
MSVENKSSHNSIDSTERHFEFHKGNLHVPSCCGRQNNSYLHSRFTGVSWLRDAGMQWTRRRYRSVYQICCSLFCFVSKIVRLAWAQDVCHSYNECLYRCCKIYGGNHSSNGQWFQQWSPSVTFDTKNALGSVSLTLGNSPDVPNLFIRYNPDAYRIGETNTRKDHIYEPPNALISNIKIHRS